MGLPGSCEQKATCQCKVPSASFAPYVLRAGAQGHDRDRGDDTEMLAAPPTTFDKLRLNGPIPGSDCVLKVRLAKLGNIRFDFAKPSSGVSLSTPELGSCSLPISSIASSNCSFIEIFLRR
jgi:hypothetical protein